MKNAFIVTILAALAVLALSAFLLAAFLSAGTVLSEGDNGRQVELAKGQTITIALSANPSTGYTWEVSRLDTGILSQVGEAEFQSGAIDPNIVGAGGTMLFRFQALSAGQTTLELVYHRPWENKTASQTFSIQVVVR